MTVVDRKLILKLKENGIEASLIPRFIRSLSAAFLINPTMSHYQANKRLEYKSALWYISSFNMIKLSVAY
jgi:hypothetical protein